MRFSFLLRAARTNNEGFERARAWGVVDPAENRSTGDRKGRGPARIKSAVGANGECIDAMCRVADKACIPAFALDNTDTMVFLK